MNEKRELFIVSYSNSSYIIRCFFLIDYFISAEATRHLLHGIFNTDFDVATNFLCHCLFAPQVLSFILLMPRMNNLRMIRNPFYLWASFLENRETESKCLEESQRLDVKPNPCNWYHLQPNFTIRFLSSSTLGL